MSEDKARKLSRDKKNGTSVERTKDVKRNVQNMAEDAPLVHSEKTANFSDDEIFFDDSVSYDTKYLSHAWRDYYKKYYSNKGLQEELERAQKQIDSLLNEYLEYKKLWEDSADLYNCLKTELEQKDLLISDLKENGAKQKGTSKKRKAERPRNVQKT